jgi:uncharacterized protein YndB with AHSA1/START domain
MDLKAIYFSAEGFLIMDKTIVAKVSLIINASPAKVWDALVKPQRIKRPDAEIFTDWQVGSLITYKGTGAGSGFEDKGKVLQAEPGRFLVCTWLNFANEVPDNNKIVRYDLSAHGNGKGTRLIITFIEAHDARPTANNLGQNRKALHAAMKKLVKSLDPMDF